MIYPYQCKEKDCNHKFEVTLSLFDYEKCKKEGYKFICPNCKSENTKRLITGGPVMFKGSGWTKKYLQ